MIIYGSKKAWFDQRNNSYSPGSTCPETSIAAGMATCLAYYDKPVPKDLDEQVIADILGRAPKWKKWLLGVNSAYKGRPSQVFSFWPYYFAQAQDKWPGFSAAYKQLTLDEIRDTVDSLYPVIINTTFTHAGHLICAVGHNKYGLIVLDSWGDANTNYTDKNGSLKVYKYKDVRWGLNFAKRLHCVVLDYQPINKPSEDNEDADEEDE